MLVLAIQFSKTKNTAKPRTHSAGLRPWAALRINRRAKYLVHVVAHYPWSRRRRHSSRATQAIDYVS